MDAKSGSHIWLSVQGTVRLARQREKKIRIVDVLRKDVTTGMLMPLTEKK